LPDRKKLHRLNVCFDLEKRQFFHYSGEESEKQVPMSLLFKTTDFLKFRTRLADFPNSDELQKRADILYETFREYLIPVVTIKEKTVEEVCPIFERINSTGTKLNIFDLMVAATWSDDFDLNDKVAEIRETTKLKDFEEIDNSVFLRFMSSIRGLGSKREDIFKLRVLSSGDLSLLGQQVRVSVERAIDFLSTDLHVPSDAFLPYESQLVVLAYYFSKASSPKPDELRILRYWFWRAGFSERYRGAVEGILDQDLHAVDDLIAGRYDTMHIKVSLVENDIIKRQFWKNSAFCKTFVVLLANLSPRNITTGDKIDTQVALRLSTPRSSIIFSREISSRISAYQPRSATHFPTSVCFPRRRTSMCLANHRAPILHVRLPVSVVTLKQCSSPI
jgi:hypothetical protein